MLWVGDPVAGVRPERVPKPVIGGAFTVVCKARSLSGPSDPGRIPVDPHGLRRGPGTTAGATGWPAWADAVGIRPGRKATASLRGRAPGGRWPRPIRERRGP